MHMQARSPVAAISAVLLAAAALAAHPAHAACGEHRDFLTSADPLLAAVRPVDCATLFTGPPEFTWPHQAGSRIYTVSLTFPDGHTESRTTERNWLSWDRPVPPGEYSWRVASEGSARQRSERRAFRVDGPARSTPPSAAAPKQATAPAAAAGSVFQLVPSESWIPAVRPSEAPHKVDTGGFFGGFTE